MNEVQRQYTIQVVTGTHLVSLIDVTASSQEEAIEVARGLFEDDTSTPEESKLVVTVLAEDGKAVV